MAYDGRAGGFPALRRDRCTSGTPFTTTDQPTMPEPDFRAALKQLADAVDGWQMAYGLNADDPLYIAMNHARYHARKALRESERLSSGKLVSERIIELLDEVEQRGLVAAEIIVGTSAEQLLRKEMRKALVLKRKDDEPFPRVQDLMYFHGLPVTKSDSEADEYVAIECQQ
jgi:hypothetical protein